MVLFGTGCSTTLTILEVRDPEMRLVDDLCSHPLGTPYEKVIEKLEIHHVEFGLLGAASDGKTGSVEQVEEEKWSCCGTKGELASILRQDNVHRFGFKDGRLHWMQVSYSLGGEETDEEVLAPQMQRLRDIRTGICLGLGAACTADGEGGTQGVWFWNWTGRDCQFYLGQREFCGRGVVRFVLWKTAKGEEALFRAWEELKASQQSTAADSEDAAAEP